MPPPVWLHSAFHSFNFIRPHHHSEHLEQTKLTFRVMLWFACFFLLFFLLLFFLARAWVPLFFISCEVLLFDVATTFAFIVTHVEAYLFTLTPWGLPTLFGGRGESKPRYIKLKFMFNYLFQVGMIKACLFSCF